MSAPAAARASAPRAARASARVIAYRAALVRPISGPDIANGAVVVDGDRIAWVGPVAGAPKGADVRDLGDVILMPGIVNAHTHLDLTAFRGQLNGLGFFHWVRTLSLGKKAIRDTPSNFGAYKTASELFLDSARAGIEEGLLHGITTYADTADNDAPFRAMLDMGVRGIAYREVFGPDPKQCDASLAQLQRDVAVMRALATDRVRVGVSPHSPISVSDALFRATSSWARWEQLPMAVHLAESAEETELVVRAEGDYADFLRGRQIPVAPRGRSPVAVLDKCGALHAQTLLIHCVQVNEVDVAVIARNDCSVAHCPRSNAWFSHGASPIAAIRAARIRVGIGTDSVASNAGMNVLAEAESSAHLIASSIGTSAPSGSAAASAARGSLSGNQEIARWVTLESARALGLEAHIGSLEPGKHADLAAFAIPPRTPLAAHGIDKAQDARFVTVAGRELVRNGRLVAPDAGLAERMARASTALAQWRVANPVG